MKKPTIFLSVMLFWLAAFSCAQAATVMMEFGRSPFHQPPLASTGELLAMIEKKEAEVRKGFSLAGRDDLAGPFLEQVITVPIEIVEYPKDTYFQWMFYKKKGKGEVKVVRDVTWGNSEPFRAFTLDIEHTGNVTTFVIPLDCGNIALMHEKTKPQQVLTLPANQAPTCAMTIVPERAFCGEAVTVNAGGSADPDGSIVKMTVSVVDGQGNVVSQQIIDTGALITQVAMPCGDNTLKVVVTDNAGADSSAAECVAVIQGVERVRVLADVGFFRQFDPGTYLFGRVGAEYRFTEEFSVLGLLGVAPHVDGTDGESAILIDALGEYSFASRYFVNFGLGGWLTDGDSNLDTEDSQLDVILGLGARFSGEREDFNTSLFIEVRSGIDELDELKEVGRFGAGLRFRF